MKICIDLEQGQEQQLNLFLQQHQLELSEFVKMAILEKLTQETKIANLPYELGKTVFGRFSSGDTERSVQRKNRLLPLQKRQQIEVLILAKEKVDKESQAALLQLLLDSPEMSDEEFQAIQEKRQHLNQWL